MSQKSTNHRGHALIIGCSIAGLFAARVLSDHFERVTILERDFVHDRPESRKGQPQTRHVHGLLAQGLRTIKQLFPGLDQTLVEGGAIVADMGEAIRWYHFGDYKIQFESGLRGILMSRPFLEWQIRRRVLNLPNVTLRSLSFVRELVATADRSRIIGVKASDGENNPSQTIGLACDLAVDACGLASVTPSWIAKLGYEQPKVQKVRVRVGYASRLYRRLPDDLVGAKLVMISPTPPIEKRATFLLPMENERWIVTAGGWSGDYPPADEKGFLEFIRSLPAPDVYDIIRNAEPISDIFTHRFPSNVRHHYERLSRFPEGYLVIGDAFASFNPIYGQGMTSAVMQAQALDELLCKRRSLFGLWRPFFKRVARVVNIPWQLAAGEDFRFPETEGEKPRLTDLINGYVAKVHLTTHHDPVVYAQFLKVMNLMARPVSLIHPRIAWRVLRHR